MEVLYNIYKFTIFISLSIAMDDYSEVFINYTIIYINSIRIAYIFNIINMILIS